MNTYRDPACLFVDGNVLCSEEDNLTIPFYALATVPLIKKLTSNIIQVWYADTAACYKISDLITRSWWWLLN